MITKLTIQTSDGDFLATYSERGLKALDFPSGKARVSGQPTQVAEVSKWHKQTTAAVLAILEGKDPKELPPLDLSEHAGFRRSVWEILRKIRSGKTASYGEVAEQLGKRGSARAVGNACGANPIPLLIPCHRVLASGGRLGGFSGGLDWKKKLLAREGVAFR
ncbi:MAG TPA: methylated-DNA--[protein]-cysteine S-methyltransferase [Verrucomicrobiae bacterium]|jgi:O-6-methylguanine DNA methyltransferase|nr:methylated-DNA--[protein]-cysteine S-methyltransferase [Verrucomicrobiae bacterium]